MNSLGRLLQILALIILPMSIILQLNGLMGRTFGVNEMVLMMVFGILSFSIGRLLEGYSPKPN